MKRRKPPLAIHTKCIKNLNSSFSRASSETKSVKFEIPVFTQKEDMSEKREGMDVIRKDLILNSPNSSRLPEDHFLFLTENENNASQFDDSSSQQNLGREWGEDILRSFAALDHENIGKFGKVNDSLTRDKNSIRCTRSHTLTSNQLDFVPLSIRKTKKTYRIISTVQQKQKSMTGILASKKVKIANKRLRTIGKNRSLRFCKHKQNIRTNNADDPVHLKRSIGNRNSCSNSESKQNVGEVEEYPRDEEKSGNLLSDIEMKRYQYQRRRGNAESSENCEVMNHVTSDLAHYFATEACDTKTHSIDANQSCTKNDQETNYILGDTKSKSPVKSLTTDVNIITSKNVKRNDSNTILTFSIDKSRVSPVGGRSTFSHSQKLLRQSKLFLIKRSARFDQEPPSHTAFSVNRELLPNVQNEKCLKRRREGSPSPTENPGTIRETELDPLATIIPPEVNENRPNVSITEANTKKEKLGKRQRKLSTKSSLQEVSVDVDVFFENNKNILRSFPKVNTMKRRGKTLSEPPHFASPMRAELSPLSRHSTSDTSPQIRHNSPFFKKAKRSRSQSHREKSIRKYHENPSDDCNVYGDESPGPSGMIRKADVNSACEEVKNVCHSNPSVTACSEDKHKEPSSCKPERACRYFLRKKEKAKTESEKLSSTSQTENLEMESNVHTSQANEMKDGPYSYRSENQGEKREIFGSEIPQSDFSIKKFPQILFPPNDSVQQKKCKSTVISKNVEEKTKKKNTRKRKLWSQSSSLDDIQTEVVNKTSTSSRSHKETCRSRVSNQFQNARNNVCTSQVVDPEKEGRVVKKCGLQFVSNSSEKEVGDCTVPPNMRPKIGLLLQQQDVKETRCVASEDASPCKTSIKIQDLHIKQNNTEEKVNFQENVLSSQQYSSGINNYPSSPRFCSGKETEEKCISNEKGILKETRNHSATEVEDNQTSYLDETITLSVKSSQIQTGNEKEVLNSNGLPNIEQLTPTNIVSTVENSPNLLRSISLKAKIMSKSPSASSTVKAKKDLSMQKTSDVEENVRPSDTQENVKKFQDTSIQFSEGNQIDSEVKDNLQEDVKTNEELSMEMVHPVSNNSKNCVNKEKLLISPTNMDIVRDARSSPLKENLHECHDQSQNTATHSFDNGVDTDCVSVFPCRSPARKTLIAKQPSVICPTNFKVASEISMIKTALNTKSDCKFLNGTGENRELRDLNVVCATKTDCAEPVISPFLEKDVHCGSFSVKNVQEVNKSPTDMVHNSLTCSNAENVLIPEAKHYSGKDEKNENTVLITPSKTVSQLPTESRNKFEDQFNYSSDPARNSRSKGSESEGNRVSESRNEVLHDVVLCRPIDAESISETSLHDSNDKTNSRHKLPLIASDSMSMPTHKNDVPECITREKMHNALCHSTIDSEKKNISRSEMISIYSELLENWKRELKVKRKLIFQQNSPGVASFETKTPSTSRLNVGNPQDNAFEDSGNPGCDQPKEDDVDSFIRIVTDEGSNTYVIMCFPPEEGEKQTKEETPQGLQGSTSDISGKEKIAKEPSTSPCKAILTDGENNKKRVKIQSSENAFSETSTVLCEQMQHIFRQTFPVIKTQGTAGSVSPLFRSEINTGETTFPPLPDSTNKCKESLKSPGKRTNDNEPYTIQLKGDASKDKEGRIAQLFSCPKKTKVTQQQNYRDGAVITEDPDTNNSNTKLSNFSRIVFSHTAVTVNCSDEEKSHYLKENQERTGNDWEVEVAAPVAVLREDNRTIPSKGKSDSTSEGRQSEELTSSNCNRRNTYLQNESRTSVKAVRNQKVIRKTLRSPYMLRDAKRDENCLSLPSRKKRQLNSKPLVNQSITLHDQDKSLQMLSHPSFLLSELTRIVRSPYLLRNRKIKSQFSFLKHSKQMRTVRKVNSHSVSKPIVKSGSNTYGLEDNSRKIRSPCMLRNAIEKPCNSSNANKKRKIGIGNKRKSASLYPISREHRRHIASTVLSTVARISRSPYLHRPERKRSHAKKIFHTRHNQSREDDEEARASQEKIQDVVGSQIASDAKVQTNAADINPCIPISKEGEREIVEESKSFTTRTYSDLDFHILSESSEHKTSRSSSQVQKYQRTSLSERTKEKSLSSHLPHYMNTMLSKVDETLSKSYPLQTRSLDLNPRFPNCTEGQIENRVNNLNDLNSVKSMRPKISIRPVQISSKTSALDKNLPQTALEKASEMLLSKLPIPVDRKISKAADDHSTSHEGREESFQSTRKEDPTSNIDIYCSSSANGKENIEISEANKCFKSVKADNEIPPIWDEVMQEETPLSSKLPSPTTNYTFSKEEERSIQYLSSPFLQQCPVDKRVIPCLSITKAQKRELVSNDLHSATSAYPNTALHSKQGSSGPNILEENNAHSSVNRRGRNKIGFEGSCWLNDEIRKLFPLPQCLDESRNRIMSSSTFIWLCSEKKSRESRFPLFKKRERTKSNKIAGKKQRGSTLNINVLGESQLGFDGGRKEMKSQMNTNKCAEKKEYCSSKYLPNRRKNRMNAKKSTASNEKTDVFWKRQELQKRGENVDNESRSVINKRISFESQEHLSSSSKGKPLNSVPDTRKKSQKMLHPPVGKGVMAHIVPYRERSKMESIIPTCQEKTLEKKQHCVQSTPGKVKNIKISKKYQKVEPKVMLNESAHSRRQQKLSNKREHSEKIPEVLQNSFECGNKIKPKKAGMSGSYKLGGCFRSTSSQITEFTDSFLPLRNNTNERGRSDVRSFRKHSENYENTKKHKREERECPASVTEGYQDAVKFLEHMHSISYSAAKMKSTEHISSSFILTTLINGPKLQADCCEINNETSTSDKLSPMNPAKKTLTTRNRNDTTVPVTNGNDGEKPNVQRGFTLPEDCSKATVTKKRKRKSKQERNTSQDSNLEGCSVKKEINRSLGTCETSSTTQDGKRLSSLPSLTSKDTMKRKQRSFSREPQNQKYFNENSKDINVTQMRPATNPQAQWKASLSAEDAKYGSQSSDEASPEGIGRSLWSPPASFARRPPAWRVLCARSPRERPQDRVLDLFLPDNCAIYRAVQRAKRQLAVRGPLPPSPGSPPPPPARARDRARVDELARRLWGRE